MQMTGFVKTCRYWLCLAVLLEQLFPYQQARQHYKIFNNYHTVQSTAV